MSICGKGPDWRGNEIRASKVFEEAGSSNCLANEWRQVQMVVNVMCENMHGDVRGQTE